MTHEYNSRNSAPGAPYRLWLHLHFISSSGLLTSGEARGAMRGLGSLSFVLALMLAGCMAQEDAGVRAAKMEAQDDASCRNLSAGKGPEAYTQCRKNLLYYRQQALVQEQQEQARRDAAADALIAAGKAMQSIDNPPQNVNVNVTCTLGCR